MSKTYVITGGTSGIASALLKRIVSDNAVFASFRREDRKEELSKISPNIYPFYIDFSKPETIKPASDYLHSKCTKIDTLINAAGCVAAGPAEKIEMSEIRRQFDVNVFGQLEFSRLLLDLMRDGKIINISSMASFGVFPFISPYCASKRCLDMFFNSLLIESKSNIKIVSIKPGVIATPLWGKSIEENSKYFDRFSGWEREMKFLAANAQKNEIKGLSPEKAADVILKADRAKNPKLSYTVGKDAFIASLVSKLPQSIQNSLIKFALGKRLEISEKSGMRE